MFKKLSLLTLLTLPVVGLTGCYVHTSSSRPISTPVASSSYYGPHPVYDIRDSHDWCDVIGPHTHAYRPDSNDFYVMDSNRYVFVGDPSYYVSNVSFNTYNYMGVHPLPVGNGWCYISGPHRHHWSPSGSYNTTRHGNHSYYQYYGSTNNYYDNRRPHYDLGAYYTSSPPPRYRDTDRRTVGMANYSPGRHTAPQAGASSPGTGSGHGQQVQRPG
ncbi:MAG: hypothetical protein FWC40_08655, partial [Proteobacteria bacterium]|nr:hypothetical protein [Pseudomonadota bacterium]